MRVAVYTLFPKPAEVCGGCRCRHSEEIWESGRCDAVTALEELMH